MRHSTMFSLVGYEELYLQSKVSIMLFSEGNFFLFILIHFFLEGRSLGLSW